jgi:hypothetical protein
MNCILDATIVVLELLTEDGVTGKASHIVASAARNLNRQLPPAGAPLTPDCAHANTHAERRSNTKLC